MRGIISPVMTEKSVKSLDTGLYVFTIESRATKNSIADSLKKLYNVDVTSVRIVNLPAKKVKFKRKPGVRSARRRASSTSERCPTCSAPIVGTRAIRWPAARSPSDQA